MSESCTREVEAALALLPVPKTKWAPEAYLGGGQSKLNYLGLRAEQMKAAMKRGFSFSNGTPREVARSWDRVWHESNSFEAMALALAWFNDPKRRDTLSAHWPVLKKWSKRIDNWAHADVLSGLYARIHEDVGHEIYSTFDAWGDSKNPWLRRLSIVSLYYYSSARRKQPTFKKAITLIERQLDHPHYYVQKGVGWALRESGNVYPRETFLFLERHVHRISSTAFSAAVEKLSVPKREQLKRLRR